MKVLTSHCTLYEGIQAVTTGAQQHSPRPILLRHIVVAMDILFARTLGSLLRTEASGFNCSTFEV